MAELPSFNTNNMNGLKKSIQDEINNIQGLKTYFNMVDLVVMNDPGYLFDLPSGDPENPSLLLTATELLNRCWPTMIRLDGSGLSDDQKAQRKAWMAKARIGEDGQVWSQASNGDWYGTDMYLEPKDTDS